MDNSYPLTDVHKYQLQQLCQTCQQHIAMADRAAQAGMDFSAQKALLQQQQQAAKNLLKQFFNED